MANCDNILRFLVRDATPEEDTDYHDMAAQLLSSDILRDPDCGLLSAFPCEDQVWRDWLPFSPSSPHSRCPYLTGTDFSTRKGNPVNFSHTLSAPTKNAPTPANPSPPNVMSCSTCSLSTISTLTKWISSTPSRLRIKIPMTRKTRKWRGNPQLLRHTPYKQVTMTA